MPDQEAQIIEDLTDLHQAMYDKMASITGITGLKFLGFDSSKTNPVLPQVAMQIRLANMEVDRTRPTPSEGHRLEVESGTPADYIVEGEAVTDVYPERIYKYPLPLSLIYEIDTWSHTAAAQLSMDLKLYQKFPERGVLSLTIGDEDFDFPIELLTVVPLDDLSQNLRERLYRYRVECYVYGWIDNRTGKIITSISETLYDGDDEDYSEMDTTNYEPDS